MSIINTQVIRDYLKKLTDWLSSADSVSSPKVTVSNLPTTQDVKITSSTATIATSDSRLPTALGSNGGVKTEIVNTPSVSVSGTVTIGTSLPSGANNIGSVNVTTIPPIPAGTNNIGKVDVNSHPPIPAGTNNIGKVDVNSLPNVTVSSLPALPTGANKIGTVDIATLPAVTISSMPPVGTVTMASYTDTEDYEASATTAATSFDFTARGSIARIVYLVNDDADNDLFISFDATPVSTAPSAGVKNGVRRLKPKEAINDLPISIKKVNFIRSVGTGNVRFMGVR